MTYRSTPSVEQTPWTAARSGVRGMAGRRRAATGWHGNARLLAVVSALSTGLWAMPVPLMAQVQSSAAGTQAPASTAAGKAARTATGKSATTAAQPAAAATTVRLVPKKPLSRQEILDSDEDRLADLGNHIMIGFHVLADVKALVAKRAIMGIFITDHNVRGRRPEVIRAEIDALQAMRRAQGLPPLIVAADQEGGTVSRLSPPLKRQPSLASVLKGKTDDAARQAAVEAFAEVQALELKRLGVTLNFAPVVDLKFNPKNRSDGETKLRFRAIDADPYLVAKVAGWYCDVLARHKLLCTLKHFPGLGRVTRDTHVTSAEVTATEGQLELNDWVPFRRVMSKPSAVTMLGHVRVKALDTTTPASFSKVIIDGLMRKSWQHDGIIVTDDFSMGAVTRDKDGVGGAAIKAMNAGADIILVSYNEKHLNSVMTALIDAHKAGLIDGKTRALSRGRLETIRAVTN
ncbi:MAG: glycoside hydrolase family 3 N-terminal domain-containing protein [Hyphomicrobium sp.]